MKEIDSQAVIYIFFHWDYINRLILHCHFFIDLADITPPLSLADIYCFRRFRCMLPHSASRDASSISPPALFSPLHKAFHELSPFAVSFSLLFFEYFHWWLIFNTDYHFDYCIDIIFTAFLRFFDYAIIDYNYIINRHFPLRFVITLISLHIFIRILECFSFQPVTAVSHAGDSFLIFAFSLYW